MASESAGLEEGREQGHRNHFRLLQEEGLSWSGREPNTLFQNRGDGTFEEVGNVLGLYLRLDSRGAATADFDGDGDLDLIVYSRNNPTVKVFRNDTPGQGNVALVDLKGVDSETMAAGAQVVIRCGDQQTLRQVEIGSGFLSQSAPTLHFGLGGCPKIDSLTVTWPGRRQQVWHGLEIDQRYLITEGSEEIVATPIRRRNYNRAELTASAGELSAQRPDITFARIADVESSLRLASLDQSTVVLNFWATWCTACLSELPDLEDLHQRFAGRGVRFVGISLDEKRPRQEVETFLRARGVSYEQVWGDVEQQQPFASLGGIPPGAIPLTAVVHQGTVLHVQLGKVSSEEMADLLEDLLSD